MIYYASKGITHNMVNLKKITWKTRGRSVQDQSSLHYSKTKLTE